MVAVELVDPQRRDQPLDEKLVSSLNVRAWKRGAVAVAARQRAAGRAAAVINAAEVDELAQILGDSMRELQDELSRSPSTLAMWLKSRAERVTPLHAAPLT